jgi:hypothetical protein
MVIIIHDFPKYAVNLAFFLTNTFFCETEFIERAGDALSRFQDGKQLDQVECVILHKDLGQYSQEAYHGNKKGWSDEVVEFLHKNAPWARIGVVSGEYPTGEKHVLGMGADFYLPNENTWPQKLTWLGEQIAKGYVGPEEISFRGIRVETPDSNPSHLERM